MNFFLKIILNTIPRPWLIKLSSLFQFMADILLRGNNYTDPINGKSYRYFLPYGYHKIRKNVLSPGTLSLERHRLVWLYLSRETDFFKKPLKVLHMAPEQCFYKRFENASNLDYTTADLNSPLAEIKADITQLPFPSASFDVVICNHVLEHIQEDKLAMSELYRVMKPGGWGIFQVPLDISRQNTYENASIIDPEDRKKHFGQYDHVRVYGLDYYDRLQKVGFLASPIIYGKTMTHKDAKVYGIEPTEHIPLVKKPF